MSGNELLNPFLLILFILSKSPLRQSYGFARYVAMRWLIDVGSSYCLVQESLTLTLSLRGRGDERGILLAVNLPTAGESALSG